MQHIDSHVNTQTKLLMEAARKIGRLDCNYSKILKNNIFHLSIKKNIIKRGKLG